MCVILLGKTKDIKRLKLKDAWASNPHGAGIVIPAPKPRVIKGIMTLDNFIRALDLIPDDREITCHLRQTTHGATSPENTHPFPVKGMWLMHNGILSGLGAHGENGASDSAHLARILAKLPIADRLPLLRSLSGRYALIDSATVHLIGSFTEYKHVKMSNDYWLPRKYFYVQNVKHQNGTSRNFVRSDFARYGHFKGTYDSD